MYFDMYLNLSLCSCRQRGRDGAEVRAEGARGRAAHVPWHAGVLREKGQRVGRLARRPRPVLLDDRAQNQKDLDRAVSHPATRHTAAA